MQAERTRGFAVEPIGRSGPERLGEGNVQEVPYPTVGEAEMIMPVHRQFRLEGDLWKEVAHNDIQCGDELISVSIRGDILEALCRQRASTRLIPQADAIDTLWLDGEPIDFLKQE